MKQSLFTFVEFTKKEKKFLFSLTDNKTIFFEFYNNNELVLEKEFKNFNNFLLFVNMSITLQPIIQTLIKEYAKHLKALKSLLLCNCLTYKGE